MTDKLTFYVILGKLSQIGLYIETTALKNEEWQNRVGRMETLEQQTFSFTCNSLSKIKPMFVETNTKFLKNYSNTHFYILHHFKKVESFLNDTSLYIDLVYFIYADITKDEHFYLEQSIQRQKELIERSKVYLKQFNPWVGH